MSAIPAFWKRALPGLPRRFAMLISRVVLVGFVGWFLFGEGADFIRSTMTATPAGFGGTQVRNVRVASSEIASFNGSVLPSGELIASGVPLSMSSCQDGDFCRYYRHYEDSDFFVVGPCESGVEDCD